MSSAFSSPLKPSRVSTIPCHHFHLPGKEPGHNQIVGFGRVGRLAEYQITTMVFLTSISHIGNSETRRPALGLVLEHKVKEDSFPAFQEYIVYFLQLQYVLHKEKQGWRKHERVREDKTLRPWRRGIIEKSITGNACSTERSRPNPERE